MTTTFTNTVIKLTVFQSDEVQGLLDICHDEIALAENDSEPDRQPWGILEGSYLTVTNAIDAIDELEHRADFHTDEGPNHTGSELTGQSASRSLRSLVKKIVNEK